MKSSANVVPIFSAPQMTSDKSEIYTMNPLIFRALTLFTPSFELKSGTISEYTDSYLESYNKLQTPLTTLSETYPRVSTEDVKPDDKLLEDDSNDCDIRKTIISEADKTVTFEFSSLDNHELVAADVEDISRKLSYSPDLLTTYDTLFSDPSIPVYNLPKPNNIPSNPVQVHIDYPLKTLWQYFNCEVGHTIPVTPHLSFHYFPYLSGIQIFDKKSSQVIYQYMERSLVSTQRIPSLIYQIEQLASFHPGLLTLTTNDIDLTKSWFSIEWVAINSDFRLTSACSGSFITFHSFEIVGTSPFLPTRSYGQAIYPQAQNIPRELPLDCHVPVDATEKMCALKTYYPSSDAFQSPTLSSNRVSIGLIGYVASSVHPNVWFHHLDKKQYHIYHYNNFNNRSNNFLYPYMSSSNSSNSNSSHMLEQHDNYIPRSKSYDHNSNFNMVTSKPTSTQSANMFNHSLDSQSQLSSLSGSSLPDLSNTSLILPNMSFDNSLTYLKPPKLQLIYSDIIENDYNYLSLPFSRTSYYFYTNSICHTLFSKARAKKLSFDHVLSLVEDDDIDTMCEFIAKNCNRHIDKSTSDFLTEIKKETKHSRVMPLPPKQFSLVDDKVISYLHIDSNLVDKNNRRLLHVDLSPYLQHTIGVKSSIHLELHRLSTSFQFM